jgi:O-antigen ligase
MMCRTINGSLTYTNLVIIMAISIFLPYIITGVLLVSIAIYILIHKQTRTLIFADPSMKFVLAFFIFYIGESLIYENWFGVAAGFALAFAMVLFTFQRTVMTRKLFDKILTIICILSLTSSACAISQKFMIPLLDDNHSYDRMSAMFLHPNYFGTITATVIIICAYKILNRQGWKWIYCLIALLNVFSIYLCESMFAWIEVFVGISTLLFISKKFRLLILWILAGLFAAFAIIGLNIEIIPRLSDAEITLQMRMKIWKFAFEQIRLTPLFGRGPMTCAFVSFNSGEIIPHAHSIFIDTFLNYGLFGFILIVMYFKKFFSTVIRICFKENKNKITSLIIAISAAALVHGLTDLTLMWIQTLPLFLFILSGIGVYEKNKESIE